MNDQTNRIVQKLWSYCNVLRDDGISYQIAFEQLTFLLFLKMADERARTSGLPQPIPAGYRWSDLANPDGRGAAGRSLRGNPEDSGRGSPECWV